MAIREQDVPQDPNHKNVIELSDSDEDEEDQYDTHDFDDYVEEDEGPTGQSPFFSAEPDVEAFNARGNHHHAVDALTVANVCILVNSIAATVPAAPRAPSEAGDSRGKSNGRGSFSSFKKFNKAA